MKFASLLTAAALVLTSAAIADAAPATKGAKAHKHKVVRQVSPPPQNADKAWWNDPTRNSFPSYSRGSP